jgi:hypothetical protein
MWDFLDVGSSPPGKDCAQLGSAGYWERARRECRAYIDLLRRTIGPAPPGAHLSVKSNEHDFGTYLSIVCWFDHEHPESVDYAFKCESEGPEFWDEQARQELGRTVSSPPERSEPS